MAIVHLGLVDDLTHDLTPHCNDLINGEKGNDVIFGGPGDDWDPTKLERHGSLFGGPGNDRVYGEDGNDHVVGGLDNDVVDGGPGDDELDGSAGDDILIDGPGNDNITGDEGSDTLYLGLGADLAYMEENPDTVYVFPDGVKDEIWCDYKKGREQSYDRVYYIGARDPLDRVEPDCDLVEVIAAPPAGWPYSLADLALGAARSAMAVR